MAQIVGNITEVYTTICLSITTGFNLQAKHLKPHLCILHRFLLENVTPKANHYDAIPTFNAYLLYCFEIVYPLHLCYIIMREMDLVPTSRDKSLAIGALLTKLFKHFKIKFSKERESPIASDISEYIINRVEGSDVLLGSMAAPDISMEDPQDHPLVAMPPPYQPPSPYWMDFLSMEQDHYNQRLAWEQQMI
ncbi:uncharacterized protein LOC114323815 isoform X1 [Camellia sinensis]|uniref:uncharacterized protein LOC114323815 isoform X1 n=1 Tax=Camellia sinensis TaxID=4442 RepID=UPI0010357E65|nr:uncharacterized protein LOC114323815 isoform X1 [Camellia sinensis]